MLSYFVRLSICNAKLYFSHWLEYFENNFMTEQLKASAQAELNMGDLVQREHPQNWGWIGVGSNSVQKIS